VDVKTNLPGRKFHCRQCDIHTRP